MGFWNEEAQRHRRLMLFEEALTALQSDDNATADSLLDQIMEFDPVLQAKVRLAKVHLIKERLALAYPDVLLSDAIRVAVKVVVASNRQHEPQVQAVLDRHAKPRLQRRALPRKLLKGGK